MNKVLALVALSAVASVSAIAAEFNGYISDTKCAAANTKVHSASEWVKPDLFEACVKKCVEEGSAPVFLTADNKMVKIGAGAMEKIKPMLGHKVTLSGRIEGDTLVSVDTISAVKM